METPSTPTDAPRPVRKGVKSVKPAHLNSMSASDEDPEHTNGRPATRRPTLDHNMVYVPGKNLKLRPIYAHKKGAKGVKSVKPAHLNSMPASDEDPEHTILWPMFFAGQRPGRC